MRSTPGPQRRIRGFSARDACLLAVVVAACVMPLALWTYDHELARAGGAERARAVTAVMLLFAGAAAMALSTRLRTWRARIIVVAMVGAALAQRPGFAGRLSLAPLRWDEWLIAACGGVLAVAGPALLALAVARLSRKRLSVTRGGRGFARATPRPEAMQAAAPLTRYAWVSVLAAVATMALKSVAYFLTGSIALLSDAAESLVNLAGAGFAVVVLAVAARPADETHPFGHGRAEYFSSGFTGALILVAATAILWSAMERLLHPQPLTDLDVGFAVAILATALNLGVARLLLGAGRRHDSITLEADGKHLMTDVWTTGAVLLGLGGVMLTGWLWLDSAIAIVAAFNIVRAGGQLIVRSLSGLIGAAIPAVERAAVERILDAYRRQGVRFHDLRAHTAGSQRLITVHVLVPGAMTVQQGHDLVQAIENDLGAVLPNLLVVTHLEPLDDPASFAHEIVPSGGAD